MSELALGELFTYVHDNAEEHGELTIQDMIPETMTIAGSEHSLHRDTPSMSSLQVDKGEGGFTRTSQLDTLK